jgi:hypothetical protein
VPSDRADHARLLRLADEQAPGRRVWALEGTGCYGAGLTRFLVDHGEWVVEIDRPKRPRGPPRGHRAGPGHDRPPGPGRPTGRPDSSRPNYASSSRPWPRSCWPSLGSDPSTPPSC